METAAKRRSQMKTTAAKQTWPRARFARKPMNVKEMLNDLNDPIQIPAEAIHIEKTVNLTRAEYDEFANNLLESREWLAGLGGFLMNGVRKVVAVKAPGRKTLVVDPSGFDYGRYVGIMTR